MTMSKMAGPPAGGWGRMGCAAAVTLLLFGAARRSAAEVRIVAGPDEAARVHLAARELAGALARLYPDEQFVVSDDGGEAAGTRIVLGVRDALWARQPPPLRAARRHEEGLAVSTVRRPGGVEVVVSAADAAGAARGASALLRSLGCGFYLSFDAFPPPRKGPFAPGPLRIADWPLTPVRLVFNWHNFLSGCSSWNLEPWKGWIRQADKAGYNAVMVHAYGNNPMAGFPFRGQWKPVGYLSSTRLGRDWATMHVNDVRRLYGGRLFDGPVFGSTAAVDGDDRTRTRAAQQLMADAFAYAEQRGVDVYFAVDVDTVSANPQRLIRSLPESARFAISLDGIATQGVRVEDAEDGRLWLPNPDTPDGYAYYRAQVAHLLGVYPQIDCLVVWFRRNPTPWMGMKREELPEAWRREYARELERTPAAARLARGHNFFALGKIVAAFRRALVELGRQDVRLAAGSWTFDFLPAADRFFPAAAALTPLDYNVLHGRSQLETKERRAVIAEAAAHRPVIPIVWAQHDDGAYLGRPLTPPAELHAKLTDAQAAGFGIIHWTTRPLDLYFESLIRQTWRATRDQPLGDTCRDMAARCFGRASAERMGEYLRRWVAEAPSFSRETGPYFFDPRHALADWKLLEDQAQRRIELLDAAEPETQTAAQRDRVRYFRGLERFIVAAHRAEAHYRAAAAALGEGRREAARREIAGADVAEVIEQFANTAQLGGPTRGEQGSIVSMNTRWLPHVERLRQQLGLSPVRVHFGPTSHDPLAQSPGRYTFHFDPEQRLWETLGQQETGAAAWSLPAGATVAAPADTPAAWLEIGRSGLRAAKPLTLQLGPILGGGALPAGERRVTLLAAAPPGAAGRCLMEAALSAPGAGPPIVRRIELPTAENGARRLVAVGVSIRLPKPASLQLTLTPVQGEASLCGALIE